MKNIIKPAILLFLLLYLPLSIFSQAKFTDKSRAIWICQISNNIKWPNINDIKVFKIGILSDNPNVYNELVKVSDSIKLIQKKPIGVELFNQTEDIKDVQVVYVNNPKLYNLQDIFENIKGKKILLISENYGFHQSMVNFIVYNNEKHYDVNEQKLNEAGLGVFSQLFLSLAIKSESVWNSYQKTDSMLIQEKLIVQSQKELIGKQKLEIDEQQQKLNKQKEELSKLFKEIVTTQKTLYEKQALVLMQEKSIKVQQQELEKKKTEVEQQKQEITKQITVLDNQKKEITLQEDKIVEQKAVLNEQLAKIHQQRLIMYLFIIVILMVTGLGYFIYRNYRIKKQANKLLQEKNDQITKQNEEIQAQHDELLVKNTEITKQKEEIQAQHDEIEKHRDELVIKNVEITKQKEEIQTQRDEIEVQRDIATHQRDQIIKQNKLITDSIVYAKRIQTAILPMEEFFKQMLNEYFILYRPKDIVSGDFYWETIKGNKKIIAVADCTGHGVPGAFMSMLGISYLNEIVIKEGYDRPDEILNHLRDHIVRSLKQQGKDGEVKDGMDISLYTIDNKTNKLEYAGANNHLTIIRDNEIIVIDADKMPISIYLKMETFSLKEFELKKGDTIYAHSDGYADQFGGPARKKYMSKRLRETFLEMKPLSMAEQKIKLEKIFVEWKGETEQIDDVLIVGIRY
jgi:serine phosphatase RsbU (regulator of sigma subunit)